MVASPCATAAPFDAVAGRYDAAFTERRLGRWLRALVWERLATAFEPGQHVLELGCGSGEDAIWLARRGIRVTATDISDAMLDVTRRKAQAAGVEDLITVSRLDLASLTSEEVSGLALETGYDGIVSNFGPLNCVADRRTLASGMARLMRPGGRAVLVVMGPVCPWEIAWHLGHGEGRTAFRRFRSGAEANVDDGPTVRVWYPSHRRLQRELMPYFKALEVAGVGLLLPPTGLAGLVERAPRFFGAISKFDRRFARTLPWRWLNDHYLMILERR